MHLEHGEAKLIETQRENLKGSPLYGNWIASEQLSRLKKFVSRKPRDYEAKYFDGDLFDIILSHVKDPLERKALIESIHDKRITKLFSHHKITESHIYEFLGSQKPSLQGRKNFQMARRIIERIYGIQERSLKPIKLNQESDLTEIFKNLDTSAGSANPGRKKEDSLHEIYQSATKMLDAIWSRQYDFSRIFLPALPFHRSQISGYYDVASKRLTGEVKTKDRLVWCVDGATVAIEGQYARPIINQLRVHTYSYAGGLNRDEQSMFFRNDCRGKNWVSVDFSSFDQTIPSWLIWEVFDIIKTWFKPKYSREIDWIRYNFIHTWIFDFSGGLIQKHRGIPSGSYFTQLVGSMCNMFMLVTYLCHIHGTEKEVLRELHSTRPRSNRLTVTTMGDDGILFTDHRINLDDMESYLKYNFGVEMSAQKSEFGGAFDSPHFLKRNWNLFGESRDYVEMWINSCHPEYFRDYLGYTPWHIIYGMYLTYRDTMSKYFSEDEIVQHIHDSGFGYDSFRKLRRRDVPGSLYFLLTDGDDWLEHQYRMAERNLLRVG